MAKKIKPSLSSLIVTQANKLISARYVLSLAEQRLILSMIARIQPDDEDFKPYDISISELADFMGISKGSAYSECKKTTETLLKRVLNIEEPGGLLQTHWVSSARYIDGSGMVKMCFDPELKPYLLKLKGNFTSCKLEMLLSFKSQYTMRVYNLLKQYETIEKREIDLGLLRETLGVDEQYKDYKNFKSRILLSTQKELAEKADLTFEFDEIKHGRAVGAIRFRIFPNKLKKSTPDKKQESFPGHSSPPSDKTSTLLDTLLLLVPEQHRAKKTVIIALELFETKYDFNYVKRNILYSNAKADKSYAGFLHNALKNDWGHDWELEQKTPIKNKMQALTVWERAGYASEKEYAQAMFHKQMDVFLNNKNKIL